MSEDKQKKKKPAKGAELKIRQFPPGLIVVSHDDLDVISTFFNEMPSHDIQALMNDGYTVIGLHSSYNLLSLTDEELKDFGLVRIKGKNTLGPSMH